MEPKARASFNKQFTEEKYQAFLKYLNDTYHHQIKFRVPETPVFVPLSFKNKLIEAGEEIIQQLIRKDFKTESKGAIPSELFVPNEDEHTLFLALDFAVCLDEKNEFTPQLIELQGFPSLFAFEDFLANAYKKFYDIPGNYSHLFNGFNETTYKEYLKKILLGNHKAKNVILLEIEPEKQSTAIDFIITEEITGIKSVCISDIILEGRKLFYINNGVKTVIERIYNRVIFDELIKRTDLKLQFHLTEDVDVEWAGHPNWFFRISKHTMPRLRSKYIPECKYLDEVKIIPDDLENYVLKPLFSFSGTGVKFNVLKKDVESIPITERNQYLLQRKVKYVACVQAPDGMIKTEIRLLYIWEPGKEKPLLITNLGRLSRGEMIGTKFNKDKTWVGGTVCFFEI